MSIDSVGIAQELRERYSAVRRFTDQIVEPLSAEDCLVQSMDDASPTRWHLAHTTWFFETFVLGADPNYSVLHEQYSFLFNSYYNTVGRQFPRPHRGLISRPSLDEIKSYRAHVDRELMTRLESPEFVEQRRDLMAVGLNHEQQHQELILTDIKHMLSCNPLLPTYIANEFDATREVSSEKIEIPAGIYDVGYGGDGFCFDNEAPRHQVFLQEFAVDHDLVTCGQFVEFMEDGGYQRPDHWLSLGWNAVNEHEWDAPLYWVKKSGQWMQFTLAGLVPVNPDWPVCHVSYFEADAFARWAGRRLPTEFEWEVAWQSSSAQKRPDANEPFADHLVSNELAMHPTRSPEGILGSVWQWTASSYQAYPGYVAPDGSIGEYNGKFMCNQYVLRGGSVATSRSHIRGTYRNFFPADTRWQFSGIRLAN